MPLKRFLFTLVTLALGLTVTAVSAQEQSAVPESVLSEFEQLIQSEMTYFNIPGAAVAVIAGDEVVYSQGFGQRDLASGAPFTPETQFRIGSTTKSMTSLMIAELVDEGLLSWDTLVTDLLPDFQTADPDLTAQITVGDLMSMGTGLVAPASNSIYWGDWDVDTLLSEIAAMNIGGDYQQFYSYNNEVYALSAYAAAAASDLTPTLDSYRTLMQERMFDPIGMPSAIITDDHAALSDNYSQAYETSLLTGELVLAGDPPVGIAAPSGAVWTNIEDMARYVITQMNGGVTPDGTRIVSAAALAETWAPGVTVHSQVPGIENATYAKGWLPQTYQGVPLLYHNGGWSGYSTQMLILPADDVALIVFANSSARGLFGVTLAYAFPELLHDLEPSIVDVIHAMAERTNTQIEQVRALVSTDLGDMSAFVGEYDEGWRVEQREDGSLWIIRGAWDFQIGYIAAVDQYIILNHDVTGAVVTFETEGDNVMLVVQSDTEVFLRAAKVI